MKSSDLDFKIDAPAVYQEPKPGLPKAAESTIDAVPHSTNKVRKHIIRGKLIHEPSPNKQDA